MPSDWTDEEASLEAVEARPRERTKRGGRTIAAEEDVRLEELRLMAELARRAPEREVPSDFTSSVMDRIDRIERPLWTSLWLFLSRPRLVRVNVLNLLSGAGAVAFLILLLFVGVDRSVSKDAASLEGRGKEYVVRFSYFDPGAHQVYVAGSFNNWRKDQTPLLDRSGRGLWTGAVLVRPGSYEYMFVVDGRWVTDENALRYKDDGFGRKNAVLNLGFGDENAI